MSVFVVFYLTLLSQAPSPFLDLNALKSRDTISKDTRKRVKLDPVVKKQSSALWKGNPTQHTCYYIYLHITVSNCIEINCSVQLINPLQLFHGRLQVSSRDKTWNTRSVAVAMRPLFGPWNWKTLKTSVGNSLWWVQYIRRGYSSLGCCSVANSNNSYYSRNNTNDSSTNIQERGFNGTVALLYSANGQLGRRRMAVAVTSSSGQWENAEKHALPIFDSKKQARRERRLLCSCNSCKNSPAYEFAATTTIFTNMEGCAWFDVDNQRNLICSRIILSYTVTPNNTETWTISEPLMYVPW